MKRFSAYLTGFIALGASSLYAAYGNGSNSQMKQMSPNSSQMNPQSNNQMNQQMTMAPADCSQLTPDQQNFANQLSDMNNRSMFCTQFTAQQRTQAMQMMGKPGSSGAMMSADQAVQQVMQSGNMSPKTQMNKKSGGGCPVQ